MTLIMRIIFFGLTGIIAGILAWPFAEIIIFYQADFPSLLVFNIVLGVAVGLLMGGCFGSSEGIVSASKEKVKTGVVTGVIIGTAGGIAGFALGQAALLFIGTRMFNSTDSFQRIGFPVSRAIGWATFGSFIGLVEGIRSKSISKMRNGLIGGFIGGGLGGLAVEYIRIYSPEEYYARLVGLVILGFLIGCFYGLIENKLSKASLRLLNGKFKDKEFLLTQRVMRIGGSGKNEIDLSGYGGVSVIHAAIKRVKREFVLLDTSSAKGTFINDDPAVERRLQDGDVIRIGEAQFLFTLK